MKILAVDTALGACSAAVLESGAVRAHRFAIMARGHAEALAPMAQAAMREARMAFAELDRLAVTVGPGTFTGQRVGLAFMRGLRLALKRPLIGVTTLEVMAVAAQEETHFLHIATLHDARRDEVYLALCKDDVMVMPPRVLAFIDAIEAIRNFGHCALAGTGAPAAKEKLGEGFALSSIRQPDALWVARLARHLPVPDAPPAPLYLRAPDAKIPAPRLFDAARDSTAMLAALHAAAFDKGWSAAEIGALLAGPGVFALMAPAGFVLARAAADEAEIITLAVAPHARRRGIGRALLDAAADAALARGAEAIFLEVSPANAAALALYGRAGFARAGTRKAYYGGDGGDALLLKAALPLSPRAKFA